MKTQVLWISIVLCFSEGLSAQKNEPVRVAAGTKVQDYFSFNESYRYPQFTQGKAYFKNGNTAIAEFNYNFLSGEMDYIQSKDTLSIANPTDIELITIEADTLYFENGYLELIYGGRIQVALKQYYQLKETQKRDSYGSSGSNSATDSYSTLQSAGQSYKLILNQDRIFQRVSEFYLSTPNSGFVIFKKKKVMKLFPQNKNAIDDYLKTNKVNFDSKEDLVRFAGFLSGL